MTDFWSSRSPRERALLALAGILTSVLLASLLVIRPALTARAAAEAKLDTSVRSLDAVIANAPQGAYTGTVSPATVETLRTGLVDLAARAGLAVSRLQAGDEGQVVVQFDAASPTLVFGWLERVEKQFGAAPTEVTLTGDREGNVRASFEFAGRAP